MNLKEQLRQKAFEVWNLSDDFKKGYDQLKEKITSRAEQGAFHTNIAIENGNKADFAMLEMLVDEGLTRWFLITEMLKSEGVYVREIEKDNREYKYSYFLLTWY